MKTGGKEKQESEEPEEPGPRSERVQSRLPPRYPGEINGKREAAGEGRRGRTRCEEVRLDEEDRGPGEKGRRGNGLRVAGWREPKRVQVRQDSLVVALIWNIVQYRQFLRAILYLLYTTQLHN